MRTFWLQCFKFAFWHWEKGEAMITLTLPPLINLITWATTILGVGGVIGGLIGNNVWYFAIIPFLFIVVFYAPYRLWETQKQRADMLEESRKPSLQILEFRRQDVGAYRDGFSWGLRVQNNGTDPAYGCDCRLMQIMLESRANSLKELPIDVQFHWQGQQEGAADYTIPGRQTARINVLYYDYRDGKKGIPDSLTLGYRAKPELRLQYELAALQEPILMLFSIVHRGKSPWYVVCRIDIEALIGDLIEPPEPPCKILLVDTQFHDLSEFTVSKS